MNTWAKRAFDIFFAVLGLVFLAPLFLLAAIAVKLSSCGPIFFRQQRIGKDGRAFYILKFRSMIPNAEKVGPSVTRDDDPRITPLGRVLRKSKLDELPQLWNVLVGDMSFVGPRPEVPRYVACYTAEQRKVLELKPGITDVATLEFRDEEELLSTVLEMERYYLQHCVPRKIKLNLSYAEKANIWRDVQVIFRTIVLLCRPRQETGGRELDKRRV